MSGLLAIETATDACSVAVSTGVDIRERHEVVLRQHNHRLFELLDELVPNGDLAALGVTAVAYGCGPGSFTGLRIAAGAAQGIAFACALPAIGVPTLAVLAQTALRGCLVQAEQPVLATLDARMDEVYAAVYSYDEQGLALLQEGPWACAPESLPALARTLQVVGSGARYLERFPSRVRDRVADVIGDVLPHARDMLPLAGRLRDQGCLQQPGEVRPVYVRDEISWKKLHEQGARP